MARIRCEQCGKKVREGTAVCPACGNYIPGADMVPAGAGDQASGLVQCPDCGREISPRAPACPHCGAPRPETAAYRRMAKPDWGFEYRTEAEIFSIPLVHVAVGRKDGRLRVAKGVIAVGQFGIGLITVAQFGIGILFGFGQFLIGLTAVAQFAAAVLFGVGQFATGYVVVGQFAIGTYALGQAAFAKYAWTAGRRDAEAVELFRLIARTIGF